MALERLPESTPVSRNFQMIEQLLADFGMDSATGAPRKVGFRFGSTTVTYPGAQQFSTITNVTHGLGQAPVAVFTQAFGTVLHLAEPHTVSSTQIGVATTTRDESSPVNGTTANVYWLVIG